VTCVVVGGFVMVIVPSDLIVGIVKVIIDCDCCCNYCCCVDNVIGVLMY